MAEANPVVSMKTNVGEIVLELFEDAAPNTVANFISLAEKGLRQSTPVVKQRMDLHYDKPSAITGANAGTVGGTTAFSAITNLTGGADTDELALARAIIEMLADHDFVLCNFKAPDLGGHDSKPQAKIAAAEKMGSPAVVLTFDPHPEGLLTGSAPYALTTTAEKQPHHEDD
jgi:2,3-bisphosphoglycerate-independent phosphoglycerate mutase